MRLIGGKSGTAYPFRFLRGGSFRDCCQPREPAGNCLRSSSGCHTFHRWSSLLHGTRDAAESRKAVRCLFGDPRKKNMPCDVGDSGCFVKVSQPSVTRGSHSAWGWCRQQSRPSPCQANSRGHTKVQCASPSSSRPCRGTCKVGYSSRQAQKRSHSLEEEFGVNQGQAAPETKYTAALNDGGSGGGGLQRLGVRARMQHSTRLSRVPWSSYGGARDKSPRRGQNRRIRAAVRDVLSDLRHARVCSEGQWPQLDTGRPLLGLSDPDAPPGIHSSPAEASAVSAWHRKTAALETGKLQLIIPIGWAPPKVKSEHCPDGGGSLQKHTRAAVKQAIQVKQQ